MGAPLMMIALALALALCVPRAGALARVAPRAPPTPLADARFRKHTSLYKQLEQLRPEPAASPGRNAADGATGDHRAARATKPVLLAPAGGWEQLDAAIKAGADAVYFGCQAGLNARARAANFALDDVPRVMATLHAHGLEGFMCMNVLVFEPELEDAAALVRAADAAGVDGLIVQVVWNCHVTAVRMSIARGRSGIQMTRRTSGWAVLTTARNGRAIVQDVGLARLAARVAPRLPLHASTQMSVTDGDGARFAVDALGANTVVVARELSVDEIGAVCAAVGPDANVEAFVHGALCVAYSGQCFSSEVRSL